MDPPGNLIGCQRGVRARVRVPAEVQYSCCPRYPYRTGVPGGWMQARPACCPRYLGVPYRIVFCASLKPSTWVRKERERGRGLDFLLWLFEGGDCGGIEKAREGPCCCRGEERLKCALHKVPASRLLPHAGLPQRSCLLCLSSPCPQRIQNPDGDLEFSPSNKTYFARKAVLPHIGSHRSNDFRLCLPEPLPPAPTTVNQ